MSMARAEDIERAYEAGFEGMDSLPYGSDKNDPNLREAFSRGAIDRAHDRAHGLEVPEYSGVPDTLGETLKALVVLPVAACLQILGVIFAWLSLLVCIIAAVQGEWGGVAIGGLGGAFGVGCLMAKKAVFRLMGPDFDPGFWTVRRQSICAAAYCSVAVLGGVLSLAAPDRASVDGAPPEASSFKPQSSARPAPQIGVWAQEGVWVHGSRIYNNTDTAVAIYVNRRYSGRDLAARQSIEVSTLPVGKLGFVAVDRRAAFDAGLFGK
jgi:hypothetical protein